jgi:hypothetical protein
LSWIRVYSCVFADTIFNNFAFRYREVSFWHW